MRKALVSEKVHSIL